MRTAAAKICFVCLLPIYAGCSRVLPPVDLPIIGQDPAAVSARYAPAKIDIMPLTELLPPAADSRDFTVSIYVSLLDSYGCQIKAPGTFRLELYEFVQHTNDSKGKRVVVWPDLDLTDPAVNNRYWRDFLRAYQFNLPVAALTADSYVVEVTCLCPSGKRLSAEATIRRTQ